jgi:RNA polymerase sigma-70 factor (ECF subfamily)
MVAPDDFQARLEAQRNYLLRFAMLQLRNPTAAEDAVQETLLAAIEGGDRFAGQSSVRTWLVGILKHKVIDHLRKQAREPQVAAGPDEEDESDLDAMFDRGGHFGEAPQAWASPEQAFEQKKFFEVLESCMQSLPAKTARAFMLREMHGMETGEICKELRISASNCWVLLFRARAALRICLEKNWFSAGQNT